MNMVMKMMINIHMIQIKAKNLKLAKITKKLKLAKKLKLQKKI